MKITDAEGSEIRELIFNLREARALFEIAHSLMADVCLQAGVGRVSHSTHFTAVGKLNALLFAVGQMLSATQEQDMKTFVAWIERFEEHNDRVTDKMIAAERRQRLALVAPTPGKTARRRKAGGAG